MPESFQVSCGAESVTALRYPASGGKKSAPTLILAHGAGAGQSSRFMVQCAEALAERGLETVTFNFLYTDKNRRVPDPPATLESCYQSIVDAVERRAPGRPIVIGGKSMGGRIATQIAARATDDLAAVKGLVLLGYPLHPPGKPEQLRTRHLPQITRPMLFIQGSRDTFGTPGELGAVLAGLGAQTELMTVEGGDHSFTVRKSSPRPQADVYGAIYGRIIEWIDRTPM